MSADRPNLVRMPGDPPRDRNFEDAVWREGELNTQYLLEHEQEFHELYQERCVLIHSGSTHEVFDDLPDLFRRCDELSPVARAAAEIEIPRRPGVAYYY